MGNEMQETFKFQIAEYSRDVFLNLTFFEVYQCSPEVQTGFDGLIGFQQY
jgi:hypothetical protein